MKQQRLAASKMLNQLQRAAADRELSPAETELYQVCLRELTKDGEFAAMERRVKVIEDQVAALLTKLNLATLKRTQAG